jgi:hypothetical protein
MLNFWYENHYCTLICYLFNKIFSDLHYTLSNCRMISEEKIGKNVKGSAHGLIWGTVPEFAWNNLGKLSISSVWIDCVAAEI